MIRLKAVEERYLVEAALFSAGTPLSVRELAEAVGLSPDAVRKHLRALMHEYGRRPGSLEVARVGNRYALQLRRAYLEHAAQLAQKDIPEKLLRTIALIAYHQPIKQSELVRIVGDRVYNHVRELCKLGLVRTRRAGQTKVLYTTAKFAEYFGIEGTDKRKIREWIRSRAQELGFSHRQAEEELSH